MKKDIKELIEYLEEGIISKDLIKNPKLNVTLFSMSKGTEIDEHTSTKQGTVYVIEGKGIFYLSGKEIVMKPYVLIYMKENEVHSLKAIENTSFILTLI